MENTKIKSSENLSFEKNMRICCEAYILSHKIGEGNFGEVFLGISNPEVKNSRMAENNREIAIKIERIIPGKIQQLPNQAEILRQMNSKDCEYPNIGFPRFYDHGMERGNNYMVFQLLGPNLMELLRLCGGTFSVETTIILAIQMFERVEALHAKGFVCRDIKPDNFMMGCGENSSVVYMIDFGLSRRYRDNYSELHRPYRQDRSFNGTQRYSSICSHLRIEPSRRDDLEALCYVIIFMLKGSLPWQHFRNEKSSQSKEKQILDKKMKTSPKTLCEGLPIQFQNILEYCLNLEYYEDPDYNYIHSELSDAHQRYLTDRKFCYDWAKLKETKSVQKDDKTIILFHSHTNKLVDQDSVLEDSDEDQSLEVENEESGRAGAGEGKENDRSDQELIE